MTGASSSGEASARIRSFVAVLLPETLRRGIADAIGPLREGVTGVSWVQEENLHVTIRFLGTLPGPVLGQVVAAMPGALSRMAAFPLAVEGLGAFPSAGAPRVLWAGISDGAESLRLLHGRLEAVLDACGVPPEPRPFHAHVTVGRVRDPRRRLSLPAGLGGGPRIGSTLVEAVRLMRSELRPSGARYTVLATAPLRAAAGGVVGLT